MAWLYRLQNTVALTTMEIRALATHPRRGDLKRPRTRIEDYVEVDADGQHLGRMAAEIAQC